MFWGSGAVPCTRHVNLKQDNTIAHVSVCSVHFLVTKFTIPIPLNNVAIMTAVLIKTVQASVPNGWMHAFDVLFDGAIFGNPLPAESTMRVKFFCPSM